MNKVHSIEKEIPEMEEPAMEKKLCEYLYIEADEDHIHRQKDGKEQGCFIGKHSAALCPGSIEMHLYQQRWRKRYTEKQRKAQRYAQALHGTLSGTSTVRKILAIREQIGNI